MIEDLENLPKIYAFRVKNGLLYPGFIKVGFTVQTVEKRLRDISGPMRLEFELLGVWKAIDNNGRNFSDKDVHRVLRERGFEYLNNDKTTEWFRCSIEDVESAVSEVVGGGADDIRWRLWIDDFFKKTNRGTVGGFSPKIPRRITPRRIGYAILAFFVFIAFVSHSPNKEIQKSKITPSERRALIEDLPEAEDEIDESQLNYDADEKSVPAKRSSAKRVPAKSVPAEVVPAKPDFFTGQIFDITHSADRTESVAGTQQINEKLAMAFRILNNNFKRGDGAWNLGQLGETFYHASLGKMNSPIFAQRMLTRDFSANFTGTTIDRISNPGILYIFEGEFSVPASGKWRFVGNADDVMFVAVGESDYEMQTVFCALSPNEGHGPRILGKKKQNAEKNSVPAPKKSGFVEILRAYCESDGKDVPAGTDIKNGLFKGPWLAMKKGQSYSVIIAMGISGTTGAFALGMQERGVDTDENFPVFTLNPPAAGTFPPTGKYNSSCTFSPQNPQRKAD